MPVIIEDVRPQLDEGPVLVTVEYRVTAIERGEFLRGDSRVRPRSASGRRIPVGMFRDLEEADRYVETFLVRSWAEHLRQHERLTNADREVEERLQSYVTGNRTFDIWSPRQCSHALPRLFHRRRT